MADWPESLPNIHLPVTHRPGNNVIRTQMDAGPAKTRARSTASADPTSFQLQMTGTQYATLLEFYKDTLSHGALEFNFNRPLDDATASFRFISPPDGRVRVGSSDSTKRVWDVQIELEEL